MYEPLVNADVQTPTIIADTASVTTVVPAAVRIIPQVREGRLGAKEDSFPRRRILLQHDAPKVFQSWTRKARVQAPNWRTLAVKTFDSPKPRLNSSGIQALPSLDWSQARQEAGILGAMEDGSVNAWGDSM